MQSAGVQPKLVLNNLIKRSVLKFDISAGLMKIAELLIKGCSYTDEKKYLTPTRTTEIV